MRQRGVRLFFVVYDLLLIQRPDLFVEGGYESFRAWLQSVTDVADGAVCISRTVAEELSEWLDKSQPERLRPLGIGWFHLAAEIAAHGGMRNSDAITAKAMKAMRRRQSVLMVGTIEPRKSHAQALSAFEALWQRGVDANLVIAGRPGWMVDQLIKQLRKHPECEQRLFWIESATDDDLQALYQAASGLLMASAGEGFGLPLVEAARHECPILTRDIPVFREVAGAHATYFTGNSGESLAAALETWLLALIDGSAPSSTGLAQLTWDESARWLADIILSGRWYREWPHDRVAALHMASPDGMVAAPGATDQSVQGCAVGVLTPAEARNGAPSNCL
jgi:hypothetical protein